MPIYDLISESTGRTYRVNAPRELTDDEVARETERYDRKALLAEQSKPFLDVTDLASSVGSAIGGLRKTLPASLQRMRVGLNRPDTYPEGAKKSFAEEKEFSERVARENTYRLLTGNLGSAGESVREAGTSLGFSVASMGSAIPASIAGGAAGTAVGGPVGGTIGGIASGMAASGAAAYRMAGSQFLDDAFNTYLQNNPGADEATKEAVYQELLPLAQNSALWEAGPEAIGNAATLGAGKIFLGIGRKGLEKIARSALAKTGAVVGAQATELATETATQLGQGLPQAKADAFNRGEDMATARSRYTNDGAGALQAFKDVAPQTLALGGLMLGAGGAVKGAQTLIRPSPTIEGEAMVPFEQAPAASETEAQDELGVAAFQQEIAQIAQEPDPIVPLQQTVNKAAETSVAANVELLPATAAVIAAGGLKPALVQKETPVGAPVVEQPASGVLLPETTPAPANFNEYELQQIEQANRDAALKALESNSQTAAITVDGNGVTLQMGDRQRHPTQNTSLTATVTDGELTADERKEAKRISQEGSLAETPEERAENKADQRALVRRVFERVYGTVAEQPVVEVPETLDQIRARLRQRLSAEERATMEQNLAQMEDEGILADVFVEERQRASQRDDVARRQREFENERQRLADEGILGDVFAEERQRATAREQQRQQPPVVEETVAPEQPVPAVEETVAAQSSEEDNQKALLNDLQLAEDDYQAAEQKAQDADELFFTERDKYDTRKNKPRNYTFVGPKGQQERLMALANDAFKARRFANDVAQDLGKARKNVAPAPVVPPVKKSKTNAKPLLSRSERRALEEAEKAASTPETVPNVEIVVDEPGAAEVGLGMEKPQTQNPYRTKVSDTEDFDFLDRLGVTEPPKDAETIPAGPLPEGTFTFRVGPGYNGNPPSRYAITPDGKIYSDSNRTMTHGGASPWVLDYVVRGSRSDTSASTPANPPVQRDVTKPEQMTPEEVKQIWATAKEWAETPDTEIAQKYQTEFSASDAYMRAHPFAPENWREGQKKLLKGKAPQKQHELAIGKAFGGNQPVSKAAVDAYGITLPEGYVQDGELYVYRPSGTVEAKPEPTPKEPEYISPKEIAERFAAESERNARRQSDTIAEMEAKEAAYKPQVRQSGAELLEEYKAQQKAKPAPPAKPAAQSIADRLRAATSRAEAQEIVDSATHDQLKAAATELNYTPKGTKKEIANRLVASVGSRADAVAIRDAGRSAQEPAPPAKPAAEVGTPINDPLGYGTALIALFPSLQKAGVTVISIEEAMTRLEAEWQKKKDSGKATRLDQIVYEANKRNTQSALDGENIGGIWTRTDKTVAVSNKATPSAMAHEVGHAIMELEYANAPEATKKAIEAEYTEWFKSKYGPEGVPTVADQRRIWEWMTDADWLNPAAPFPQEQRVAKWEAYRSGFNEWFADEVAKWAVTRQQPRTLVDKFFSEIAAKLQKLWDSVKSNFSPNETLASWLDAISTVSEAKKTKPAAEVGTLVAGVPAEVDAFFNPPPLSETVPLPRSEKIKIGPAAQQGFKARVKIAADEVSQIRSGYDGVGRLMEVALERGGVDEAIAFREWLLRQKDLSPEARRALLDFALPREQADWLKPKDFGSSNVVVTKETKDKAVKNLRKKIGGQTNVGLDPSILKDAIAIGAFYLEGGARSFKDFSAKMIEDFGAGVQKYLRPAYDEIRKRTDIDTTGMDPEEGGEPAPKAEEPKTPPPPVPKAEAPKAEPKQEVPKPAPAAAPEPATVPIANDPVDAQRVALGLPPIMRQTQEAYTFPQMWADAEAAMKADPNVGKTLVESLNKKPRTISALEDAILLRERVNRVNTLDLSMVEFNNAPKGNNETQRDNMDTAITELTKLDDALNVAGTEQGRSLNARKMLARQDYTLAKMITALRAANDGNLSESDVAMVTRLQKQIAEAQAKLAEVESGQAARVAEAEKVAFEAGRQEVIKDIEDRAKADAERLAEMQRRKTEYQAAKKEAATKPNKWAEIREAARARNAELRSNLYSDVVLVKAASMAVNDVIIGATYIAEGVTKLADWVTSMRGEGYNLSDKEMEQLFNESKAFDAGEELPAAETPLKTRKAKAPAIDKVKAIAADEESLDSRTVYELVVEKMKARAEASQGAKLPEMSEADLTSVIREVTADVQQYFPDITEREVRDLFSGYGKILQPSQDELSKQIRQLSALGKLASAIEDAKAKIAPLKSGPQRDKATQAIRLQQKKLARELRMSGLEYAAGEGQLRSPLDAIKARLNNQINDLALEINQRQKIKKRPSVDYDRETEALVTLRDDLKRISDEVNKPAGPTLEETVAEEMKKIDKRILELQKLIAENKFKPKEDTLLHTAELDAKRDVRDGLNKTLQKMRKEAADKLRTQDDIDKDAIESAQESIDELERKIAAKDVSRPQRRTPTETAEYQALIEKKKSLQQVLAKLRESIEGKRQMSDEQRIKAATKALDASIARMTGMITSGKFDVVKRTPKTPDTPELKAKREARNNLRKRILELRKLKRDAGIDPIAKQISTDKKRIQTRMKKLQKRMDDGDFSKPVKKQRATDEALLALQVEEEKLKEEWAKIVFERQLASRGPGKKILDATQQTLNTARAVLTSFDVSAVLRQAGFIVLGNPLRGLRNLGPMFKAFGDAEFAKGEKFRMQNRENYKNGLYQQSKLFLADTSQVNQMSKQEEAFMTRWLEKVPRALGGGILRGSQRAYTVFLNRLRMDSFDAMVANLKKGDVPTPQEIAASAKFINTATGRGDLGKFNQAGTLLNTVYFAPRLVWSRFLLLAGHPYFTASGRTKALVLREYAKFLAGAAVVYALGSLAQDDDDEPIETDPRSSDFLKIRFGDTRVDPLSGLIQATVFVSRLASGEKKTAKGKIVPIRGDKVPYGGDTSFDVLANFNRTKFSPIIGSAVNMLEGKNVVGESTDALQELKRMVIPMSFGEAKETLEAQGIPEATALIMLQMFGMGVQTYTPGKK